MNAEQLAHYLAVVNCPGIGAVTFKQLHQTAGCPVSELHRLPSNELSTLGLTDQQTSCIKSNPPPSIDTVSDWLQQDPASHHVITLDHDDYPELLYQLHDAPPLLYAKGQLDLLSTPQIAIVGSRNCTPGGANTAREFARYLAQSGLTITSGMALGIDCEAHNGALEGNGNTIAVVGTGIDRIYPAQNRQLAHQIADNGLILSEFPLGTAPHSSNFPKRNRIISALSLATLVVEAAQKSGSLITARLSMELGREVFAIPGSIHNPQSRGCHELIRQGAKLVDRAQHIIDDIGSLLGFVAQQIEQEPAGDNFLLDEEYQQLLQVMGYDPVSLDTLLERSGLTIEQLSSMLLILELNDLIQTAPGGLYIRC